MIDWKFDFVFMLVNITQQIAFHPLGLTTNLTAPIVTTKFAIKPILLFTLFALPYMVNNSISIQCKLYTW